MSRGSSAPRGCAVFDEVERRVPQLFFVLFFCASSPFGSPFVCVSMCEGWRLGCLLPLPAVRSFMAFGGNLLRVFFFRLDVSLSHCAPLDNSAFAATCRVMRSACVPSFPSARVLFVAAILSVLDPSLLVVGGVPKGSNEGCVAHPRSGCRDRVRGSIHHTRSCRPHQRDPRADVEGEHQARLSR